ncbi:MAG: peptidylprolyl isomerase [Acidobacteria bacterium]|nr:peptidylprolyl isomerase [Acidobacteriota bacterium]
MSAADATTTTTTVVVDTTAGSFSLELHGEEAPATVARFLARAGLGPPPEGSTVVPYAGTQMCESRAHGYLVFGCAAFALEGPPPGAPRGDAPQPDEIDAAAMGLGRRLLDDPKTIEDLWQRELFPRYSRLREAGKPVPPGLAALVDAIVRGGTANTALLAGKSRLWYLQAIGYEYAAGRSARPLERGAIATANTWPGEADARFLLALAPLPDRDGRATVFGRVASGWDVIDAIQRIPVNKGHRSLTPVLITRVRAAEKEPPR